MIAIITAIGIAIVALSLPKTLFSPRLGSRAELLRLTSVKVSLYPTGQKSLSTEFTA